MLETSGGVLVVDIRRAIGHCADDLLVTIVYALFTVVVAVELLIVVGAGRGGLPGDPGGGGAVTSVAGRIHTAEKTARRRGHGAQVGADLMDVVVPGRNLGEGGLVIV